MSDYTPPPHSARTATESEAGAVSDKRICVDCGAPMYSKEEAGYPGLWHCANCGRWYDTTNDEAWRFTRTEELLDIPTDTNETKESKS